jgi:hypothetical protein
MLANVVHVRTPERDPWIADDLHHPRSVVIVEVRTQRRVEQGEAFGYEPIKHCVGVRGAAAINQQTVVQSVAPLGHDNAVRVSQRKSVNLKPGVVHAFTTYDFAVYAFRH